MASRLADDGKQAGRRRRAGWQAGKQLQAGEQAGNCRLAEAGTWLATQATAEQAGTQAVRVCSFHRGCFESISISLQKL